MNIKKSFTFKQLANFITLTRVLGVGFIFWLTPYNTNYWQIIAVLVYITVCITDFLDGWVARKLDIVSDLGKILDPLADKILVLVFLPLLEMQIITSFPVFIILAREYAIMAVRVMSAKQGTIVAAKISGKIKTAVTLPVCGILLGRVPVTEVSNLPLIFVPLNELRKWVIAWPNWIVPLLIWSTVAITLWSFLDYFWAYIWQQLIKKAGNDEEHAKRILRSLIPNTFSMLNLTCGISAAFLAWFGLYNLAVLLVILGIFFDALDGPLARKFDAYSKFGATLDSNADFVSFGIAPAVIIFRFLSSKELMPITILGLFLAISYYLSVQYRLKRFNKSGHLDYFAGLPSPVGAALILVAAVSSYLNNLYIFIPLIILASVLMISKIPYAHLGIATKTRFYKYCAVLASIFMFLSVLKLIKISHAKLYYSYEILFALICIYLLSPVFTKIKTTFLHNR